MEQERQSENNEKSISKPPNGPSVSENNERDHPSSEALSLPSFVAGSGTLDRLPPVSGKLSAAPLFLYFSGGRDRTMIWDIHRNERRQR
jgi:hypothetical protein